MPVSSVVRVPTVALLAVLTGVWLYAQPKPVAAGFGPTSANPAYIVASTPTTVLFTSRITDRQLKKHSVVLVRLDSDGKVSDILGRLKDDGRNGDLKANDNTYSLRVRLNEAALGPVSFKVAARFKPGKWRDFEPDDDDWDKDLTNQPRRDHPGQREWLRKLFSRFIRYTVSPPIVVTVDPFVLPPDPGEAGKQTLLGIDADGDGVRDDFQRHVGIRFVGNAPAQSAGRQYGIAMQAVMLNANPANARVLAESVLGANYCLSSVLGVRAAYDLKVVFHEQYLNTAERRSRYDMLQLQLRGAQLGSPQLDELAAFCANP